jgi:hypothetical protein
MNRKIITLSAAVTVLCLGAFQTGGGALAQDAAKVSKQQTTSTWFYLMEAVAQPDGCKVSAAGSSTGGLITVATADRRSWAHYVPLPAKRGAKAAIDADEAEPLALLSAYVVRPDGTPDPAYGSRPKDIVILTTGDGRVIVTFSDFNADAEGYTYPYPATVRAPSARAIN